MCFLDFDTVLCLAFPPTVHYWFDPVSGGGFGAMVITLRLHLAVSLGAQLLYSPMVTTLGPPLGGPGSALLAVIAACFKANCYLSFRGQFTCHYHRKNFLTPKIVSGPPDVCPWSLLCFTCKVLTTTYNYFCHLFCSSYIFSTWDSECHIVGVQ